MSKKLSIKLTPGKLKQVQSAIATLEDYLAQPGIAEVVQLWPQLPEATRQEIRAKAPTFDRLMTLAEKMR